MKLEAKQVATAIALVIATGLCTGCTQFSQVSQKRLKSPAELFHNVAFGRSSLTTSEYTGSDHARDWDLAEHAAAIAEQQQRIAAPPAQPPL